MAALLSLIRNELRDYASRYELTPREHDVLSMLIQGASSVSAIADGLGLSRNTVHNHFKNMFRRTGADNKAALVAMFARESLGRCAQAQAIYRQPRVLLVAPDSPQLPRISASLKERGMRPFVATDVATAVAEVARQGIDVVVTLADAELAAHTREALQAHFGVRPKVLTGEALWPSHHDGLAGLDAEGSLANDALVFGVLHAFVEDDEVRNRLVRVESELQADLSEMGPVTISNVGFGGAFASVDVDRSADLPTEGSTLTLTLRLPVHGEVVAPVRVAWTRPVGDVTLPRGLGLVFGDLSEEANAALQTFVRRRKLAWLAYRNPALGPVRPTYSA